MTTVKWERELTMTEPEESVLVKMAQFFIAVSYTHLRAHET